MAKSPVTLSMVVVVVVVGHSCASVLQANQPFRDERAAGRQAVRAPNLPRHGRCDRCSLAPFQLGLYVYLDEVWLLLVTVHQG